MFVKKYAHLLLLMLLALGCDSENSNNDISYDRTAFLENFADNLIIPGFADYATKVSALHMAAETFAETANEENLLALRGAHKAAWLQYQYVAFFEIGPSASRFFRDEVNIFPTDSGQINAKIANSDYTLTGADNIDVKGFPAIDYLLHGVGASTEEVLAYYGDAQNGFARFDYLLTLTAALDVMATDIAEEWAGAYRDNFIENLGTDVGSSTGFLVNEFNKQFDLRIKNGKVGIPSGVKSFERVNPDKVECLYGGYSKELALQALHASLDIFKGIGFTSGTDGEGFDDYLDALGATTEEVNLSVAIIEAIQQSASRVEQVPTTFYEASQQYDASGEMVNAYNALQAVIPLIKVDMTSAMGVTITFQDNDGD